MKFRVVYRRLAQADGVVSYITKAPNGSIIFINDSRAIGGRIAWMVDSPSDNPLGRGYSKSIKAAKRKAEQVALGKGVNR